MRLNCEKEFLTLECVNIALDTAYINKRADSETFESLKRNQIEL